MNEVRVYLELIKLDNGEIMITTGGGVCNNGQMETHDSLADAIKDLNERVVVEYTRLNKNDAKTVRENLGKSEIIEETRCPNCGGILVTKYGHGISCTFCVDCDYDDYNYDL